MFRVIENPTKPIWLPVDYNNATGQTVYVGQIVCCGKRATAASNGVFPWIPAGVSDSTAAQVPFGVVIGTNNRTPLWSTTYNTEYITAVQSQAAQVARDWVGQEGMFSKADPQPLVQVALLSAETVLEGDIKVCSAGTYASTALTEAVVTTGSTTGAGFTPGTTGFDTSAAAVAYNYTCYCRTGGNMGLYRTSYDTAATGVAAKTFYTYWPYDIAIGDKFVGVPLALGSCLAMFDTTPGSICIDANADVDTTNYINIDVLSLDLRFSGKEVARFRLNPLQYLAIKHVA